MDRLERRKQRALDKNPLAKSLNEADQEDLGDILKQAKGMIENQDMLTSR